MNSRALGSTAPPPRKIQGGYLPISPESFPQNFPKSRKYKLPTGFHKSLVVFNLHRAKEHAKDAGLIVVEGFFDALRLWQAGFRNVVALMGSTMSEEQEALIVSTVGPEGKATLMLDEDEAGRNGRDGICKDREHKPGALQRLASQVYVKAINLGEEGRQPDSLSEEEITRAIRGI
jgi:DNA primase